VANPTLNEPGNRVYELYGGCCRSQLYIVCFFDEQPEDAGSTKDKVIAHESNVFF
jgi:hypothetical protein